MPARHTSLITSGSLLLAGAALVASSALAFHRLEPATLTSHSLYQKILGMNVSYILLDETPVVGFNPYGHATEQEMPLTWHPEAPAVSTCAIRLDHQQRTAIIEPCSTKGARQQAYQDAEHVVSALSQVLPSMPQHTSPVTSHNTWEQELMALQPKAQTWQF